MADMRTREEVVHGWAAARRVVASQMGVGDNSVFLSAADADRLYGYIQHLELRAAYARCSMHDRTGCADCDWGIAVIKGKNAG
jgi:hypothetical protein